MRSNTDNALLNIMYKGTTTIQDFCWDNLTTVPILYLMSADDINYIKKLITSPRYSGNNKLKMEKIDELMHFRGFTKFAGGTNRIVYTHPSAPNTVFKVAIDSVGINDNPAEYRNQQFLKPYCCKVFECSPCGTIASFEMVDRITTFEEFYSIADDYFYLLSRVILGKYVMEDIGIDYFMNVGIRKGFGVVILDFPYLFELDGAKLECSSQLDDGTICKGEIDYDHGFNKLICSKCGRIYRARDLAKPPKNGGIIVYKKGGRRMKISLTRGSNVVKTIDTCVEREFLSKSENSNKPSKKDRNSTIKISVSGGSRASAQTSNNSETVKENADRVVKGESHNEIRRIDVNLNHNKRTPMGQVNSETSNSGIKVNFGPRKNSEKSVSDLTNPKPSEAPVETATDQKSPNLESVEKAIVNDIPITMATKPDNDNIVKESIDSSDNSNKEIVEDIDNSSMYDVQMNTFDFPVSDEMISKMTENLNIADIVRKSDIPDDIINSVKEEELDVNAANSDEEESHEDEVTNEVDETSECVNNSDEENAYGTPSLDDNSQPATEAPVQDENFVVSEEEFSGNKGDDEDEDGLDDIVFVEKLPEAKDASFNVAYCLKIDDSIDIKNINPDDFDSLDMVPPTLFAIYMKDPVTKELLRYVCTEDGGVDLYEDEKVEASMTKTNPEEFDIGPMIDMQVDDEDAVTIDGDNFDEEELVEKLKSSSKKASLEGAE